MRKAEGQRTDERRGRKGKRRWLFVLGPWSFVLWLLGCAGGNNVQGDPLLGVKPQSSAATQPTGAAAGATASVPPLPAPAPSTSPAALTSGRVQPLDATHDLRIGSPAGDNWKAQGTQVGATLRRPEPLAEGAARPVEVVPPRPGDVADRNVTLTGGPRTASFEQNLAQLLARGVNWYHLETVSDNGEVKFECFIPNRQNPNIRRHYEARAADAGGATRAVLEQIDKDR
jgi:hypothetical protein